MKFKNLLPTLNIQSPYLTDDFNKFCHGHQLSDLDIPTPIENILQNLKEKVQLTDEEVNKFNESLTAIKSNEMHDALVAITNHFIVSIIGNYKETQKMLEEKIDQDMSQAVNYKDYVPLYNIYHLTNGHKLATRECYDNDFFDINYLQPNIIIFDLPFILNMIAWFSPDKQALPPLLQKPLFPYAGQAVNNPAVKKSEHYYPYKIANKLYEGDTGNKTYVAVQEGNKKKKVFVRVLGCPLGVLIKHKPEAVLASKIATFVSKKHFASEFLLDNGLGASRKLAGYHLPVTDENISQKRDTHLGNGLFLPGVGMIDEVLNFINETDSNNENVGLSSDDLPSAYLTKIDYDHCKLSAPINKKDYEGNLLHTPGSLCREGYSLAHLKTYKNEKLTARLKLCLLTPTLLAFLAEKAGYPDEAEKNASLTALSSRLDVALQLFLKAPDTKDLLQENPNLLNDLYQTSLEYIKMHCKSDDSKEACISALNEKTRFVKKKIKSKFKLDLEVIFEATAAPEITIAPSSHVSPSTDNAPPSFLKQHWKKIAIGAAIGIALAVAGVFTAGAVPALAAGVGIGVAGAAALGFGTAALVGSLVGAGAGLAAANVPTRGDGVSAFLKRHKYKIIAGATIAGLLVAGVFTFGILSAVGIIAGAGLLGTIAVGVGTQITASASLIGISMGATAAASTGAGILAASAATVGGTTGLIIAAMSENRGVEKQIIMGVDKLKPEKKEEEICEDKQEENRMHDNFSTEIRPTM